MPGLSDLARRLGHQQWFATVFRVVVPLDRLVGRLTRGRVVALGVIPSLLITTTGRRSGKPRTNPLLYVPDGDAYVVIGSNWGQPHQPSWALNLLADSTARVTVKGREIPVRGRAVSGEERDRLWHMLVSEWPAYQTYLTRAGGRDLRIFRLEPTA
ncbi:nitroreductase/quinone reductase family protein [Micromonospora zhanjiangensis]|uniref:Nitroreductase/quinone reductase family protein n=1 Tax=Micromonospora zhanjiangensis TaxID=1522057 RepID=A0ABV8KGF2_9ACTN